MVADILEAVVKAVDVPVTLKIRTGWNAANRNGVRIASIAESAGVAMLAVHGRTREMMYTGQAEYDTIAEIKSRVRIPVVANGDIDSPLKAKQVLDRTNADAVMIGRGAQGRPWLFREINHYLDTGEILPEPSSAEVGLVLCGHLERLYAFYGEDAGVRIARKHLGWYAKDRQANADFRNVVNKATSAAQQINMAKEYFFGDASFRIERRSPECLSDRPNNDTSQQAVVAFNL